MEKIILKDLDAKEYEHPLDKAALEKLITWDIRPNSYNPKFARLSLAWSVTSTDPHCLPSTKPLITIAALHRK